MAIGHPYGRSRAFAESPSNRRYCVFSASIMEKNENNVMELNRETAMRLWVKHFGKETKATDFSGRVIAKGAYGDRNSEFGWNVDHILPQSKGGTTADHNLVCCHILTNDEKADRFPAFVANGRRFEIIKVQNHYEIRAVEGKTSEGPKPEEAVNYYDAQSGIRFFKKLKGIQNKPRFVGSVLVRLKNVANTAVVGFIEKLFDEESISFSMDESYRESETRVIARNFDMPTRDDISNLLEKCVLLNTYLYEYFEQMGYIDGYEILYRVDSYREKSEMYSQSGEIGFPDLHDDFEDVLYINKLVVINTSAQDEIECDDRYFWWKYDKIRTKISSDLRKEAGGK